MNAPRCSAHSSRTGQPCKRLATLGATVCRSHGAAAPQVLKSARERLAALVDPAIEGLRKAIASGDHMAVLRGAQIVLDRAGFGPRSSLALSSPDGEDEGLPMEIKHTVVTPGDMDLDSLSPEVRAAVLSELHLDPDTGWWRPTGAGGAPPRPPDPLKLENLSNDQLRKLHDDMAAADGAPPLPPDILRVPAEATFRTLPAAKPGKSSPPGDSTSDPPSAPAVDEVEPDGERFVEEEEL